MNWHSNHIYNKWMVIKEMIESEQDSKSFEMIWQWTHKQLNWINEIDSSLDQLVISNHQSLFILFWWSESRVYSDSIQSDYDSSFDSHSFIPSSISISFDSCSFSSYSSNSSKLIFNFYSFISFSFNCCSCFYSKEPTKITVWIEDECDRIGLWLNLFLITHFQTLHSLSLIEDSCSMSIIRIIVMDLLITCLRQSPIPNTSRTSIMRYYSIILIILESNCCCHQLSYSRWTQWLCWCDLSNSWRGCAINERKTMVYSNVV